MAFRHDFDGFSLECPHEISDPLNENIDVFVCFDDGRRYSATFATISNIQSIMNKYKSTGECLSGRYFWCVNLIVVNNLDPLTIGAVVEDLIKNNELSALYGPF